MSNITKQKTKFNKKTGFNKKGLKQQNAAKASFLGATPTQSRKIKVGNIYSIKITALSSNNLGLNEVTYGFPVLIGGLHEAKASLGDVVQVKVLKIQKASATSTPKKYAIAKIVKVVKKATNVSGSINSSITSGDLLNKVFDVTILKKGPKGSFIAQAPITTADSNLSSNYKLIINPAQISKANEGGLYGHAGYTTTWCNQNLEVGQKVSVQVTRVKTNYGFAKLTNTVATLSNNSSHAGKLSSNTTQLTSALKEGTKLTLTLPKKAKRYLKHIVIKLNTNTILGYNSSAVSGFLTSQKTNIAPTILFVKPFAGAKLGDKVQIQIVKSWQTMSTTGLNGATGALRVGGALSKSAVNFAIGQIYQINPFSSKQKKAVVKANVQKMLNSGMHYGEQAIKCNARMKNYVLYTRTGSNNKKNATLNKPLIQKGRNIINLLRTRRCLHKALAQLTKYAAKGKTFLFVGTKKAAAGLIARASLFSKKAFFVNTRWLGGMLTNWKTILKSISKIRPILKEKQVIIKDILEKRQNIKTLLMEKAFLLKKKSRLVLKKGKQLVQKLNASKASFANGQKATLIGKQLVEKGQVLLEKRQSLLQKRKALILQSQSLYKTAFEITQTSKELLTKATIIRKKLREFKSLLFVSIGVAEQLQKIKQQSSASVAPNIYTVSYNQYKQLNSSLGYVVPNPPKEILNKMVLFIKQNSLETSNISKKESSGKSSVFVLTKFLSQFSSFAPSIKLSIQLLLTNLKEIQTKLVLLQDTLKQVVAKMQTYVSLKNNIVSQLHQIQQSLVSQRNIIRVVKRKLKQIAAQKRLIQFLPKLRYLPTPSTKIAQTVQVLMKKIVDPKLKYPIDSIYDQKLSSQSKKVAAMRKKKWQRLEKYLGGISNMTKLNPNQIRNNVAIIVGQQEEMNAVRECQKLGIKMFHIVDTNCNPGFADHFIPANDDSRNSIKYILTLFLTRIILAQKIKKTLKISL
jgi:ribosomal protein S2